MEKVQETGIMKKLMMLALAVVLVMPALIAPSASAVGSTGPRFTYEGEGTEDDPGEEDCDDALWIDCGDAAGGAEAPTPEEPPQEPELWPEIVDFHYADRWHGAELGYEPVVGSGSLDSSIGTGGGEAKSENKKVDTDKDISNMTVDQLKNYLKELEAERNRIIELCTSSGSPEHVLKSCLDGNNYDSVVEKIGVVKNEIKRKEATGPKSLDDISIDDVGKR